MAVTLLMAVATLVQSAVLYGDNYRSARACVQIEFVWHAYLASQLLMLVLRVNTLLHSCRVRRLNWVSLATFVSLATYAVATADAGSVVSQQVCSLNLTASYMVVVLAVCVVVLNGVCMMVLRAQVTLVPVIVWLTNLVSLSFLFSRVVLVRWSKMTLGYDCLSRIVDSVATLTVVAYVTSIKIGLCRDRQRRYLYGGPFGLSAAGHSVGRRQPTGSTDADMDGMVKRAPQDRRTTVVDVTDRSRARKQQRRQHAYRVARIRPDAAPPNSSTAADVVDVEVRKPLNNDGRPEPQRSEVRHAASVRDVSLQQPLADVSGMPDLSSSLCRGYSQQTSSAPLSDKQRRLVALQQRWQSRRQPILSADGQRLRGPHQHRDDE
eukprot:TRINITY_DN51941_c0_g1_i1.p1 TRINITY_DN51941_c0_g1~~TRINITY_DN51941_c0_g1_i1.p1  ORF type:complete len:378 (+),score=119.73 TRINITY_DN51941_c0_g1_i1:548-1681(+)